MTTLDEIRQQMELLADEELVAILREHDEEQWRPEVFDIVASILNQRGISLNEDSDPKEDIPDEPLNLNLVTVALYDSSMDAETDRLALESMGLKAWIFDEHNLGTSVHLQVLQEDWRAAMKILDPGLSEGIVPSSELPDDIAEPPCPKCGSRKVKEEAEIIESAENQLEPEQAWFYRCTSCGHKW